MNEKVKTDDKNTIILSIEPEFKNVVPISDIIDSVYFIKLETTEKALISKISNILFTDSLLFIHDKKSRTILVFDINGSFKHKISHIGNGPGEYIELKKTMIDEKQKKIIVYDDRSRKLIYYSYSGEIIKEVGSFSENAVIRDIINLPNGNFLCYYPTVHEKLKYTGLWEVNSVGEYIKTHYMPEILYPIKLNENDSYLYNLPEDGIGLATADLNDIYHYQNDTLKKYLHYKLSKKTNVDFPNIEKTKENFTSKIQTYEKANYIISEWTDKDSKPFVTLFSKLNGESRSILGINYNDAEYSTLFGVSVNSNLTDRLVSVVYSAFVVDELKSGNRSDLARKNLEQLTEGMSEHDIIDMNPILQVLYLK